MNPARSSGLPTSPSLLAHYTPGPLILGWWHPKPVSTSGPLHSLFLQLIMSSPFTHGWLLVTQLAAQKSTFSDYSRLDHMLLSLGLCPLILFYFLLHTYSFLKLKLQGFLRGSVPNFVFFS